jgi:sensor histidine kinase YesM
MKRSNFFFKYKLHHILFWAAVFGVWYYFRYQDFAHSKTALIVTAIKVVDLAIMIYTTNYVLIPFLLYKKRYFWFTLTFIAMIVASSIWKMYILGAVTHNPQLLNITNNLKGRIYDNMLPHFLLVIAGAAFKLMRDYGKAQRRMAEIAKEKAETELNFLKSQINPHFLFNSLNSVYFLINKDNPEARNALHKFSEMLRYQLYEMMRDKNIPIEKEIRYLEDYVDLQKLRKDEKYSVEFNYSPDVKGFAIEPLILIPFVENAFKHISHNNDKMNFIKIDMTRNNGEFHFSVENSKDVNQRSTEAQGGIGLTNVKRRLELLYPNTHELSINDNEETYQADLKIKI